MSDFYSQDMNYTAPQPQKPRRKPVRAIISMVLGIYATVCAVIGGLYLLYCNVLNIYYSRYVGSHVSNVAFLMNRATRMLYISTTILGAYAIIAGVISLIQGSIFVRNYNEPQNKMVLAGRITSIVGMALGLIVFLMSCTSLFRFILWN